VYGKPGPMNINKQFAILFKMGTLEETKDRAWTWVLSAPIDVVQAAGVNFDPNVRSIKSVQGDAGGTSSAFEVSCPDIMLCWDAQSFLVLAFRHC